MGKTKRFIDFSLSVILLFLLFPVMILFGILIKVSSKGPIIHWSKRVGLNNKIFFMPKFRTMKIETPQVATHLLSNPESYLTPIGNFLRRFSIDELPQLFSIVQGEMSFIGPRPALHNQIDLIEYRTKDGIHNMKPGITGWAQVNGRDELSIPEKVSFERDYMNQRSLSFDVYIIWLTLLKVIRNDGISH
tara:strand:- start:26 stop:595 length:570 start_codon:yes stop_codon:yes gene_type:complete